MSISLLNYENYVLDFLEGALGHQDQLSFLQFLQEHPQIAKEIRQVDAPKYRLQPSETIVFPGKRFLKKRIDAAPKAAESKSETTDFQWIKKDSKAPVWLYFSFTSLSWVVSLVFICLFFYWKNQEPLIINVPAPELTLQINTAEIPLPAVIEPIALSTQNLSSMDELLALPAAPSLMAAPLAPETFEELLPALEEEVLPVLAAAEQAPAKVQQTTTPALASSSASEEETEKVFDFSTEKKAIKSAVSMVLFSIRKAKRKHEAAH